MINERLMTTKEVAEQLGVAYDTFLTWLSRYPEYRPPLQMGAGSWVWTAADIERAKVGRIETRGRKPYRTQKKQD